MIGASCHFYAIKTCSQLLTRRGLSRQGKMKREEKDLWRLPTGFLSRMLSFLLTTSDVFATCDTTQRTVWIWVRAREAVEFERALKKFKWTRVEDETTLRVAVVADPITSLWGKPKRRILRQIFRSSRVFQPPKHTYLEWNLLGFMELLVLLRLGTILFEEKAICGVTSGQRWMEWFPC